MKYLYFLLISLSFSPALFSQDDDKPIDLLSVSPGLGMLTFNGDIGKGKDVSKYTYIRGGYSFNIEKRFANNWIGASLNIMNGKLAMGERSTDVARNKNFETSLMQFGLNLTAYVQNKKGAPVIPFLTTGIAYASLNAKTDLKYNGDSLYYYWSDGGIRNLPELPANEFTAHHVTRDYIYETPLDSASKSTPSLPIGLGMKLRMGPKVEANIGATYHICFSDGIDAFTTSGNDKYLYSYFSLTYNIQQKSKAEREKEKKASNVDYASIDKLDLDGDGVKDNDDLCPGTPKAAKVDAKGCPVDEDSDGIPDYADKEKNTRKGSIVDADGRTVTDAMILEKAKKDSIASGRNDIFKNNPSMASLQKLDSEIKNKSQSSGGSSKIPQQFRSADTNKDGLISSSEIAAIVDGFFDGSNDYTVEKIHALIDYFFEQ